jgi:Na+-transporting NADH:ubiquinone oxidoreductase subunit NqrA
MTSNVSRDFARRAHAAGVPQVLEKALLNSGLLTAIRQRPESHRTSQYVYLLSIFAE